MKSDDGFGRAPQENIRGFTFFCNVENTGVPALLSELVAEAPHKFQMKTLPGPSAEIVQTAVVSSDHLALDTLKRRVEMLTQNQRKLEKMYELPSIDGRD